MRLLLFAESIKNSAGIERMAISLANELSKSGHNVDIVVCGTDISSFYQLQDDIVVYTLGINFREKRKAIQLFRKLVKRLNPDIVINVAIPMGQISIPALAFLRNSPVLIAWEHFHLYAGSSFGYIFRLLSAIFCDKTVVLTKKDKSKYPLFLQKKIECIYNFTLMYPPTINRPRNKIVLAVGRLAPQKGFDLLLPIWKEVTKEIRDWKLIIIGDGVMEISLKQQVIDLGISDFVDIIQPTPQIVDYYQQSSIYVMSSRFEGLPMVLMEAKMNGLPIISYDCPNGPSEIIRNGIDGYVVPMGESKVFIAKLIYLIKDTKLREEFSEQCKIDATIRFGVPQIIEQWNNLFYVLRTKNYK